MTHGQDEPTKLNQNTENKFLKQNMASKPTSTNIENSSKSNLKKKEPTNNYEK